jgi:hypothetical protein
MGVFPRGRSAGCRVKEKTTMKILSGFANGKAFAVTMLILIFTVAVALFKATIYLAK